MSRDEEVPFCYCGHTDRWHIDQRGEWTCCYASGCQCLAFTEAPPNPPTPKGARR